jgi:hypothetical protein
VTAAIGRIPDHKALGLGAAGLSADTVRDRLALIATVDPEHARTITEELMTEALKLIADGYPTAARLAAETLTICSLVPSGYAAGWMA